MADADDVVGHELTHGVTDYESNLVYIYQSGAISESLSDIWGEFVDLTNGRGNDSIGVRWLSGEDLAGGPARDMQNPPAYNHPDRMKHPLYWRAARADDNGGVHINSGVGNKAAYLMTDGDTFNGITVSGISSGADFVVNLHVAHSSTISGVGVFAGQAYHCSVTRFPPDPMVPINPAVPVCEGCPPGMTVGYDHCKNNPEYVDVSLLVEYARYVPGFLP